MSISVEKRVRENDVVRDSRHIRIAPTALPAFRSPEAAPLDPHTPLEQVVLKAVGVENLGALPQDVARKIIMIDAFDPDLVLNERKAIFAYGFWLEDGDFVKARRFTGLKEHRQIDSLLNHVLNNDRLAVEREDRKGLCDLAEKELQLEKLLERVESFGPDNEVKDRLKAVVKMVVLLDGKGLTEAQILAMKAKIHLKTRLRPQPEAFGDTIG
jgi:hypothetical protein